MGLAHFVLLLACTCADELKAEFRQDFSGGKLDSNSLQLFGGPNPGQLVKQEQEGLRITLPGTQGSLPAAGVSARFRVRGDFEVTASYEILNLTQPATGYGVGPSIYLKTDRPNEDSATIQRVLRPDGMNLYIQGRVTSDPEGKRNNQSRTHPAGASVGKLCLRRSGSTLHYLVAEADASELRELGQEELGTAELATINVRLQTGDFANAVADIRWRDLTIRAAAFGTDPLKQAAQGPAVFTISGEQIAGNPTAIQDGNLVLGTSPARQVPLDEVHRVVLANKPTLAARWIGQDNQDLVQVGAATGGNGIQDMHIVLTGLVPGRKFKQIIAICPHPKRQGVWKLDPTGTPTWRIGIVRTEDSDTADLLLEPHEDVFDQVFTLTITYEEGEPVKVTTKVTTHTDTQLKMNATAAQPAATDSGPARVTMHLEAGDRVRGELLELTKELIKLRTAWSSEMEIPLLGVLGVEFGSSPAADAKQRFQEHLHKPGTEDTALVRGQDQAITAVSGKLEGLADGKVRFAYEGEIRSINQPRLIGLVFAAHPTTPRGVEPYQIFQFTSGDKLSGSWTAIDGESLELLTPWNRRERVPAAAVSEVSFRNGKMVYLSDLEPATVEEVPYFGRLLTYRRDQNLFGQPLKMKGKTYAKGLAVHSRCTLSYQIDGRFATFKCLAGFDDSAGGRGRVLCRVLGDGKELFVEKDLRGDQEPRPVEVTIADVKQLTLEVDFGEAEDTGDRVIWADPQLFRSPTN